MRETPLLLVPPMINKFYIADVAPGRSMLEYFVGAGQQCFTISWRNPDERHAEWGLDDYVSAVIEALEAVEAITGSAEVARDGAVRRRHHRDLRGRAPGRRSASSSGSPG